MYKEDIMNISSYYIIIKNELLLQVELVFNRSIHSFPNIFVRIVKILLEPSILLGTKFQDGFTFSTSGAYVSPIWCSPILHGHKNIRIPSTPPPPQQKIKWTKEWRIDNL